MGAIQSGINQAIQTAAIINQLQDAPEKRKTIKTSTARIDEINKLHKGYQEDLKAAYEDLEKKPDGEPTPEAKAEFEKNLKKIEPLVQKQIDERAELSQKYIDAGGSKGKYQKYAKSEDDAVNDILVGEPGGLHYSAKDIIRPTSSYKGNFNDEMYAKALELAAKQRKTYGYVNEELKKNIAKYTEGYNGK